MARRMLSPVGTLQVGLLSRAVWRVPIASSPHHQPCDVNYAKNTDTEQPCGSSNTTRPDKSSKRERVLTKLQRRDRPRPPRAFHSFSRLRTTNGAPHITALFAIRKPTLSPDRDRRDPEPPPTSFPTTAPTMSIPTSLVIKENPEARCASVWAAHERSLCFASAGVGSGPEVRTSITSSSVH